MDKLEPPTLFITYFWCRAKCERVERVDTMACWDSDLSGPAQSNPKKEAPHLGRNSCPTYT